MNYLIFCGIYKQIFKNKLQKQFNIDEYLLMIIFFRLKFSLILELKNKSYYLLIEWMFNFKMII